MDPTYDEQTSADRTSQENLLEFGMNTNPTTWMLHLPTSEGLPIGKNHTTCKDLAAKNRCQERVIDHQECSPHIDLLSASRNETSDTASSIVTNLTRSPSTVNLQSTNLQRGKMSDS